MPKRSIEEIYRDANIPDDRLLKDLLSELGEDVTLSELRRAYKGFEQKMSSSSADLRKKEEEFQQIAQNAAAYIQQLEAQNAEMVAKMGNAIPQNPAITADPLDPYMNDETVGPLIKALTKKWEPSFSKLSELEKALKEKDEQIKGLGQFIGQYGDVFLMEGARRDFESIPDRDPEVTFETAYQTALKEELWNDFYRQKNPNTKIPDVRKAYQKISGPKTQERLMAEAERKGYEKALRENRGQTFFPPPSSSALGTNPANTPKSMDEAFAGLSNDPEFRNLFGR